jgi:hypothetical protein
MTFRNSKAHLFATILLVGDSHTYQSFGRNLDALLRASPQAQVASFASWGTSPEGWLDAGSGGSPYFEHDPDGRLVDLPSAPTPIFPELLTRYHPGVTIIALGSNLFGAPFDYSAQTVHQMAELTARAHSACIWVGPPDSRERSGPAMDELYGVLRGASAPYCQFVDSRELTHYPPTGGDGLHYDYLGPEGRKQTESWARKVFEIYLALTASFPLPWSGTGLRGD